MFFYLFDKFPNNIGDSFLYEYKGFRFSFFNEDYYNLTSLDLKYAKSKFDFTSFYNNIKNNTYFLHLTGDRKKFISQLRLLLTNNNN